MEEQAATTEQQSVVEEKGVEEKKGGFGFTAGAENLNGRLAMLGFAIGLLTEVITGQSILSQIGLF